MKKLVWVLLIVLVLMGCDNIAEDTKTVSRDPSQLLYLFASITCMIACILAIFGNGDIFMAILQSVRISSALCVVVSPLLLIVYEPQKVAISVGAAGVIGLVVVTVAFWKDFYPDRPLIPKRKKG